MGKQNHPKGKPVKFTMALVITGDATHYNGNPTGTNYKSFDDFLAQQKQIIENYLNYQNGVITKSYLDGFVLDNVSGDIKEH